MDATVTKRVRTVNVGVEVNGVRVMKIASNGETTGF
jgi:hypothetical protein